MLLSLKKIIEIKYLTDGFECKMCDSNCNICDKDGNCVECKKGW